MSDYRCLTCRFWVPAFPEPDLARAERALAARLGPHAGLAGACSRPECRIHRSSRHTCHRWRPAVPSHVVARAGPTEMASAS